MEKLLVINSSARAGRSQSRKLTEVFAEHWKRIHAQSTIGYRELGNADVPHINESWIAAAFKPETTRLEAEKEILKASDIYISELLEADVIVLASPMYNWSIPSVLKAYIDQIVRVNKTFKFNPANAQHPYTGLLEGKTLFLLLSRGEPGYEEGDYNAHLNFQSTYLKTVFNIMGVSKIHVVAINGLSYGPEKLKKPIEESHQDIRNLIERELV
jgi:FMN-dependent NADH-azoreductase